MSSDPAENGKAEKPMTNCVGGDALCGLRPDAELTKRSTLAS